MERPRSFPVYQYAVYNRVMQQLIMLSAAHESALDLLVRDESMGDHTLQEIMDALGTRIEEATQRVQSLLDVIVRQVNQQPVSLRETATLLYPTVSAAAATERGSHPATNASMGPIRRTPSPDANRTCPYPIIVVRP